MSNQNQVQKVLADLRHRWPESTEADAIALIQDSEWAYADERAYEARDMAFGQREFDDMAAETRAEIYGTDPIDERNADQDECARFHL